MFDEPHLRDDNLEAVTEFTLEDNERLVGIVCGGRGLNTAAFCDFQFIIGIEKTKFELLKLMVNRKVIKKFARSLSKNG